MQFFLGILVLVGFVYLLFKLPTPKNDSLSSRLMACFLDFSLILLYVFSTVSILGYLDGK